MFDPNRYIPYIGACIVLVLAPGPDMAFILGRTLAQGRKAGMLAAIGVNLGGYVHLGASVLGLSAVLAASAAAFTALKFAGAAYLAWIGLQAIARASRPPISADAQDRRRAWAILRQGFLSDVLNPKVALFFLAFLPQFVDLGSGNEPVQLLALGVTLNMIAITINLTLVHFAGMATAHLRENGKIALWLNRAMGTVFILLGIRLAFVKS
jgi:threonine/homoserine/homoserine lactone efflux protein